MHRHEFDRGDAQSCEVFDHGGGGETGIGSAQVGGNFGVALGEPFHVEFTNHSLVPWNPRRRIRSPGKSGVDDPVLGHPSGIVTPIKRQVLLLVSDAISKVRVAPNQWSLDLFAIGIEQKLVGIETMPLLRSIRAIHTVAVYLAGAHFGQVPVPDHIRLLGKGNAHRLTFPRSVEQAKLDFFRMLGIEREVDTFAVPSSSQGIRAARPNNRWRVVRHLFLD